MTTVADQLTAIGKAQMDTAVRFATIATQGAEKLAQFQIESAKAAFADGVKTSQTLAGVKDAADLPAWAGAGFQPGIDKAVAYGRSLYELVSGTQSELAAALEEQVADFNKQVSVALEAASRSAPAGSESAVTAVKAVIATTNSVYESIAKAGKQLVAMTEANLAAAGAQAPAGRKKAA